jgi:hypothetical protein
MSKVRHVFIATMMVSLLFPGFSQEGYLKVKAKGVCPDVGMGVSAGERVTAISNAKKAALKRYGSEMDNSSRFELYENILPEIYENIEDYVVSFEVLKEGKNKATKAFEIYIEASLDTTRIEREIKRSVSQSSSAVEGSGEPSLMVFVFVGRKVAAVTTSDGKRVEFVKTSKRGAEGESMTAAGEGVSMDYDMEDLEVKEYGGKSIAKAQKIEWEVTTISSVDTAVNEIFTKANYECVDPRDVEELDLQAFLDDYATGDDVSDDTRRSTISLLRDYEVPLFATGRLDILLPDTHPVTGQARAYVKVEAKITSLEKRLPRTVAAIRGIQYQGLGDNSQVAIQNALNEASKKAAKDLVDQLRAKGIR